MRSDGEVGFGVQPRAPEPLWVSLISTLTLKTSSGQAGNFPTEGPHPNSPNTQSRSVPLSPTIRLQVKKRTEAKNTGRSKRDQTQGRKHSETSPSQQLQSPQQQIHFPVTLQCLKIALLPPPPPTSWTTQGFWEVLVGRLPWVAESLKEAPSLAPSKKLGTAGEGMDRNHWPIPSCPDNTQPISVPFVPISHRWANKPLCYLLTTPHHPTLWEASPWWVTFLP